jgi:hypothetical protein
MMYFDNAQRVSAFSGMALIVMIQLNNEEVLKTIILAGLGGISSYLFTLAVKFLLLRIRKKFK